MHEGKSTDKLDARPFMVVARRPVYLSVNEEFRRLEEKIGLAAERVVFMRTEQIRLLGVSNGLRSVIERLERGASVAETISSLTKECDGYRLRAESIDTKLRSLAPELAKRFSA